MRVHRRAELGWRLGSLERMAGVAKAQRSEAAGWRGPEPGKTAHPTPLWRRAATGKKRHQFQPKDKSLAFTTRAAVTIIRVNNSGIWVRKIEAG